VITIKNIEDLIAWQEAVNLARIIWNIIDKLPKNEYVLRKHLWECARNIPGNIAEGFGRPYSKESRNFYNIANGSLTEIHSDLYLACFVCQYIDEITYLFAKDQLLKVRRLLSGLTKSAFKVKRLA
jgi:four helix bundle protein